MRGLSALNRLTTLVFGSQLHIAEYRHLRKENQFIAIAGLKNAGAVSSPLPDNVDCQLSNA
jgi:hypothetical protein